MADSERRMDLQVFSQSAGLGVMQVAALKAFLKQQRHAPTHATLDQWRRWLREALGAVVTG